MKKPTILITLEGGLIQNIDFVPGVLNQGERPEVQVWDFDTDGGGANAENSKGEEFIHTRWTGMMNIITPDVLDFTPIEGSDYEDDETNE